MGGKRLKWIVLVGVVGISVLAAFWGLGSRALGNHEAYVGVAARNMIESGDWVVPIFNGETRLQKTPLPYWLAAITAKAAGRMNEFIVRLPNAAMAVLSAMAIFYFVYERLGFRSGAIAAIVWSSSLCYINYSHTGRPEMGLVCFVAIAMLSFYSGIKSQSRKKQILFMLVFWASFGLAMLAKGPAPLLLVIPAIFIYFLIFKQWKLIPKLLPIAGVILFLLIVLPWPMAVLRTEAGAIEVWKNEFLGRAAGEYAAGSKPFYYYFGVMFLFFLPYSAFIPFAAAAPFYKIWEQKRDAIVYHWLWFFAGIIVMSVCGGKRPHYILPMMPAMAVLTGIILEDMLFVRKVYGRKFSAIFSLAYMIVLLGWLSAIIFILPGIESKEDDENYVIRDYARKAAAAADDKEVIAYCKVNPSFIYYFGKDVPVLCNMDEIYAEYLKGGGITASGGKFEQLKKDGRFRLAAEWLDKGRGLFVINQINEQKETGE
jgi:4-amino-4-deoxy-L-arabinose transferase-like glycosyltransferase